MEPSLTHKKYIGRTANALNGAKDILSYDPKTGVFTWLVDRRGKAIAGSVAGTVQPSGHVMIMLNGKMYQAHRLAWWWVNGELPKPRTVDHRDNNGGNNRIKNLRRCTPSLNCANRPTKNKSGYRGVHKVKNRYKASIRVNGKAISLGSHRTAADAALAYDRAAIRHFGEFARLNFPVKK